MNKLKVFKIAASIVVGSGTATISNNIIQNNVQPANMIQQISVGVASLVIGSMASEATRAHTDRQIDNFVEIWNRMSESKDSPATA
jgi:hypothetical protein